MGQAHGATSKHEPSSWIYSMQEHATEKMKTICWDGHRLNAPQNRMKTNMDLFEYNH